MTKDYRNYTNPGDIVRVRREELGLSQTTVARLVGLKNANFITMLEKGKSSVPPARIIPLARALHIDHTWFAQRVLLRTCTRGKTAAEQADIRALFEFLFDPENMLNSISSLEVIEAHVEKRKQKQAQPADDAPYEGSIFDGTEFASLPDPSKVKCFLGCGA
jgi:transcriptional regulator with XRE-family HTH domain